MADNKLKGTFPFAANYEVTKADALDPRVRWNDWAEMVVKTNWPYNGDTIYLYKGLTASVGEELWMLVDVSTFVTKLNTVGIENSMYNVVEGELVPIYSTTSEIAEFLGWKIVGGGSVAKVDEHILKLQ